MKSVKKYSWIWKYVLSVYRVLGHPLLYGVSDLYMEMTCGYFLDVIYYLEVQIQRGVKKGKDKWNVKIGAVVKNNI